MWREAHNGLFVLNQQRFLKALKLHYRSLLTIATVQQSFYPLFY